MSTRRRDYLVMSRKPDAGDAGSWTSHQTRSEAEELARQVRGRVYRRTRTTDADGLEERETIRRVKLTVRGMLVASLADTPACGAIA